HGKLSPACGRNQRRERMQPSKPIRRHEFEACAFPRILFRKAGKQESRKRLALTLYWTNLPGFLHSCLPNLGPGQQSLNSGVRLEYSEDDGALYFGHEYSNKSAQAAKILTDCNTEHTKKFPVHSVREVRVVATLARAWG